MKRADGRTLTALRPVTLTPDVLRNAEGSALIEMGGTRVLCAATVEDRVPVWLRGQGRGWVTAEYGMLPRSTPQRVPRDRGTGGRAHEIQRLIGRSLRAVTDLSGLGERTLLLDCDVLEADGGTRTAAVTGACVALALALRALKKAGAIPRVPIREYVAAVSVGLIDGRACLDLTYEEDARADVDMNIVMTGRGRLVEVQGTAERAPFSAADLDRLVALAAQGIRRLVLAQRHVLGRLA